LFIIHDFDEVSQLICLSSLVLLGNAVASYFAPWLASNELSQGQENGD
jgi:hypothetical protein